MSNGKRLDLRFGSFACSVQGFDDPVMPVQQVLRAIQHLLEETPELADAAIEFDAAAIERLVDEVARRADLDPEAVEIVPGLIIVHHGAEGAGDTAGNAARSAVERGEFSAAAVAAPVGQAHGLRADRPQDRFAGFDDSDDRVDDRAEDRADRRAPGTPNDATDADTVSPRPPASEVFADPFAEKEPSGEDAEEEAGAFYDPFAEPARARRNEYGTPVARRDVAAEVDREIEEEEIQETGSPEDEDGAINLFSLREAAGPAEDADGPGNLFAEDAEDAEAVEDPGAAAVEESLTDDREASRWHRPWAAEEDDEPSGPDRREQDPATTAPVGALFAAYRDAPTDDADSGADEEARPGGATVLPLLREGRAGTGEEEAELPAGSELDEGPTAATLAARAKATKPAELMVAAAAFLVLFKGQTQFTRKEVLEVYDSIPGEHDRSLEARFKGFGRAVRDGHIVLIEEGSYGLSRAALQRFEKLL